MYINRYIKKNLLADLKKKMVFISGPRQSGKTTFAKNILKENKMDSGIWYLNWDSGVDREHIIKEEFPAGKGYIVLDEIHKYSNWRQVVKGLFDKRGDELKIIVTGSARLDYYRKGGDSLQGRYHFYRLMPFSLNELPHANQKGLEDLFRYGGFPEQYFSASETESARWSREYRMRVIQDDLRDLENVSDISKVEQVSVRLPVLVGAPLSINSLREDISVSHQTLSRWIQILENLYMIFRIYPFGQKKIRAVKKEAKHYHLDWNLIEDRGSRFENMMAVHLLKWIYFEQDTKGRDVELRFFRDIDRREVDFVIMEKNKPIKFIECKLKQKIVNPALMYLKKRFSNVEAIQISLEPAQDLMTKDGIRRMSASKFLLGLI